MNRSHTRRMENSAEYLNDANKLFCSDVSLELPIQIHEHKVFAQTQASSARWLSSIIDSPPIWSFRCRNYKLIFPVLIKQLECFPTFCLSTPSTAVISSG